MVQKLRFIPEEGALVEVTCRTIHGRFLMTPSPELREIIVGVLARAQRRYPVEVCGLVFLSNHFHLLLTVPDALRLSRFMCFVNSNLAREAGRLSGWREKFWARRYRAIVVSQEEGAQIGRLRYLLAHGCKEGLVARPQDWPGVHGVEALLSGEPLLGYWFDRTREYAARARRERFHRLQFATAETLSIEPLPCWRHLPSAEIRQRIRDLLSEIEAAVALEREGKAPLGVDVILGQNPHEAPERLKRAPAPEFHTVTRRARLELREAYRQFVAAFRAAAAKLRAGDRSARFPPGSFPPALSFVEALHPT